MERDGNETSGGPSSGATHSAYEPVADTGSSLREKAGGFKNTIADALQSGAEKLRLQAANETSATTVEAGGSFSGPENRLGQTFHWRPAAGAFRRLTEARRRSCS